MARRYRARITRWVVCMGHLRRGSGTGDGTGSGVRDESSSDLCSATLIAVTVTPITPRGPRRSEAVGRAAGPPECPAAGRKSSAPEPDAAAGGFRGGRPVAGGAPPRRRPAPAAGGARWAVRAGRPEATAPPPERPHRATGRTPGGRSEQLALPPQP